VRRAWRIGIRRLSRSVGRVRRIWGFEGLVPVMFLLLEKSVGLVAELELRPSLRRKRMLKQFLEVHPPAWISFVD
jgi:hypothetical protein